MIKIKNIVVPTDFSDCAQRAYELALNICKQFNSKMTALHARTLFTDDLNEIEPNFEKLDNIQKKIDGALLKNLQEKTAKANRHIVINNEITRGISPAAAILEYIELINTDLVVMGTHGHNALTHLLLGSVAEQIIRYSPCPVLTIRPDFKYNVKPEKILVPFDFTNLAQKALHYAINFARKFNSSIDLLYVYDQDVHPALYAWGMKSIKEIIPDIKTRAEDSIKMAIKKERASKMNINYNVEDGKPHRVITQFAKDNGHDLIIIATHSHTGLDRFLLGSVTEKVVRLAGTAVLTLKIKEREIVR
jgi:nucleotide-binding universal stress UspA family protein